jgi:hypothetical protein
MYRTFDEEVFLAPESIISGVLAASAFDSDLELPDIGPLAQPLRLCDAALGVMDEDAHEDAELNATTDRVPGHPVCLCFRGRAANADAWSRQAFGANGFGG